VGAIFLFYMGWTSPPNFSLVYIQFSLKTVRVVN
jgi:hypothetical protein